MIPQVRELRLVYSGGVALVPAPRVDRPSEAAALLMARLQDEAVEVCMLLLLDTKHHVIAQHELARGTLEACLVHPREVFKAAVFANAAGIIFAHNHPSGDPTPSSDDIALCNRLPALDTGVLPVACVYGANASGKTNLFRAIAFMDVAVNRSHRRRAPEGPIPVDR